MNTQSIDNIALLLKSISNISDDLLSTPEIDSQYLLNRLAKEVEKASKSVNSAQAEYAQAQKQIRQLKRTVSKLETALNDQNRDPNASDTDKNWIIY